MSEIRREDIELLAPAGHWDAMRAAVANGANAVYFGVEKFNARARANNFLMEELPEIMEFLHTYGVKGFLTFNILVFENELEGAQELVEACVKAGVDAVIVQDLGLVKLIREISPDFPIHGSTQMTMTSAEAVEFVKPYNIERVVLGRENNLKQIKKIHDQAKTPIETFVHGALCVSYSGQCLTSEMWGGRSANRGECAQACRLPYDMMVDGEHKPMGDITYLLSPKDLAAIEIVPQLIEAGVTSFKIEGRMKSAEYVANVVSKYRKAIDAYFSGVNYDPDVIEIQELEQSFSRGFTPGFLLGTNNKTLVDGTFPKKRGVYLGQVKKIYRDSILVDLQAPLKRGDGIVFDFGDPTQQEEGGRVYDIRIKGQKIDGKVESGPYEIVMGRDDVNLKRINIGDKVWRTSDPELERRLRKSFEHEKPYHTFPLAVNVYGAVGQPLVTTWTDVQKGHTVTISSEQPAEEAIKRPLDEEILRDQLGRLGGTVYYMDELTLDLVGNVIVPKSELNRMRREAAEQLLDLRKAAPQYTLNPDIDVYEDAKAAPPANGAEARLHALCRSLEQIQAAGETDVDYIYADFEFVKDYPKAVQLAHDLGKKIALATPRIHMPGEAGILRQMIKHRPDAILIRNTGAAYFFEQERPEGIELIGDFSLNIANHKAVELFKERGMSRVTASYDLNSEQMVDLLTQSDARDVEIVIHQHMPMFHTEHCVYCTFLSEGTDYTNCGRPCEERRVSLKDRVGMEHPVRVDTGCRNTVYNAVDQSGADFLNEFLRYGVNTFRVEFLEEEPARVKEVLGLYRKAMNGEITGSEVWKELKAINQLGVTGGTLIK
ncbi:MAG TPA: DUF3656 domain-containing protein [Bacilli bacterium]|nr:DUF3656 domain-containing protein [Bacilli bacterium]